MPTARPFLPALALSLTMAVGAGAQTPVPTITLDRAAREYPEPFSAVLQVLELKDRRVLLIDNAEKELRVVDLARGTMAPIGRQGAGPLEYRPPGMLLPGAADTAVYYDIMQQRLLLISPLGAPLRTVPLGKPGDTEALTTRMQPSSVDALGRLYGQTLGLKLPSTQSGGDVLTPLFTDTVAVQSLEIASGKVTALAKIRNPATALAPKVEMNGSAIKLTMTSPDYSPSDAWAVLPDGRVAILRDGVYRVHLVGAGRVETVGPLIPARPIPVNAGERKALLDSVRRVMDSSTAQTRKMMSGAGGKTPTFDAVVLEPRTWAASKPPYAAMQASPDGRLWVTVSQPAGAKSTKYDILNGAGALIAKVTLAPGERIVGLGRGTVYTIRKDEDDLQYLRMYSLPKLP